MDQKVKEAFYKSYANLPLNLRSEIIVIIDDEPLTWNVAKIEIDNETKRGEEILSKLIQTGILKI